MFLWNTTTGIIIKHNDNKSPFLAILLFNTLKSGKIISSGSGVGWKNNWKLKKQGGCNKLETHHICLQRSTYSQLFLLLMVISITVADRNKLQNWWDISINVFKLLYGCKQVKSFLLSYHIYSLFVSPDIPVFWLGSLFIFRQKVINVWSGR